MISNRTQKLLPHAIFVSALLSVSASAGELQGNESAEAKGSSTGTKTEQVMSKAETATREAWLEGRLDTIYLFNRHLNNFSIDPDVEGNKIILTGKVESEVDKELAGQLALSMSDIDSVDNQLTVVPEKKERGERSNEDRNFSAKVEDATLTAEVKMKLLANSQTEGLAIHVTTVNSQVELAGDVSSGAEKDLAGQIAKNVDGVSKVKNQLRVQS